MRNAFNIFQNLKTTQGSVITFDNLVEKIRTPNESAIEAAEVVRKYGKNLRYDEIKKQEIQVFHPNMFRVNCCRRQGQSCEVDPTGYIFLDFDNVGTKSQAERFRDSLGLYDFTTASWLSLSQTGVSALVAVEGNNKHHHPYFWEELSQLFDYPLDPNTKDYSKLCCIPYDPDLYVSYNTFPYKLKKDHPTAPVRGQVVTYFEREDNKGLVNPHDLYKINWSTPIPLEKFTDVNRPYFLPKGFKYLKIDAALLSKRKIKKGARHKTLSALSMQFIVLNPFTGGNESVLRKQLRNALLSLNNTLYMPEPLPEKEVVQIMDNNYSKFKQVGLDVSKYYINKCYVWHPDCRLSAAEKRSIGQREKLFRENKGKDFMRQSIHDAIVDLQDGENRITKSRIADYRQVSIGTVKTYWKEFIGIVEEYNSKLRDRQNKPIGLAQDSASDIERIGK